MLLTESSSESGSHTADAGAANILCVFSYLLGDDSASWRVLNIATALRKQGYTVTVHQHVRRPPVVSEGIPEKDWRNITRRVIVSSRPASFIRHLLWVSRGNFDAVIGVNINGALISLLGRLRTPLVLDLHGDMVAELEMCRPPVDARIPSLRFRARKAGYKIADNLTRRFSDRFSCVSRKMMSVMCTRGVPKEKLVYAPNCVDLEFFKPCGKDEANLLRDRLGISRDKLLIGYLGRSHPWQGVDRFVEAARALVDDPELAFLVVGANETKREGNLLFVKGVQVSEMPYYYSVCDVFVLPRPSHLATEVAAPTKFAEYAAMSRPIIASDVGDASELIHGYGCGLVVSTNTPAELINSFSQIKQLSEASRSSMGEAARKMAEIEFNLEITRSNLAKCIEELTHSR